MWMWVGNNLQTLQLLSTLFMDTLKLYKHTQAVKHSGHLEIKFAVLTFQHSKPKMAYSRYLADMDCHGLSWMTCMDDFHG